jgi:SSS family solute:Na+ symporter/sodium/proline symporter
MTLNVFFRDAFPTLLKSPVNAGAFAMLAGLLIIPLVSAFTRAPKKEAVEHCFECFDETVTVSVKEDLGN